SNWDQQVKMPPKGGPARSRSIATLQAIFQSKLTDPEIGSLLTERSEDDALEPHQAASVRIMKRDFDRAIKVPESLVREIAELEGTAYEVWTKARPANDFPMLEPYLTKMVDLKKQQADAIGWEGERYNALLDEYEPWMTATEVESMFGELTTGLEPLVGAIVDAAGDIPSFTTRTFDAARQEAFSQWLVKELHFDTEGGRLDTSPHPFTATVSAGDIRQTTRADPDNIMMSIFATMHETGHALYEQGLRTAWADLPVGKVPSLGMHESQSRLWENLVGRSRSYCNFMHTHLKRSFPDEMHDVDDETFYRGAKHPRRSLIRITADEVTYNLHVALRFGLELALFRDDLQVSDLPGAWNERMEKWLGIIPPSDADGVMQDVHWSAGLFGYFPTYTIGTLYASAFFGTAKAELGNLDDDLARGDTSRLLAWLQENIYSQGYLYPAKELGQKVIGAPISAAPFLGYVKEKYGALYGLDL
ncbi:MAG: carboxypeptidase M32, partial [Actinomycetota bacterium]